MSRFKFFELGIYMVIIQHYKKTIITTKLQPYGMQRVNARLLDLFVDHNEE